jgi:hypothetical protein
MTLDRFQKGDSIMDTNLLIRIVAAVGAVVVLAIIIYRRKQTNH